MLNKETSSLLEFINNAPTPFHAIEESKTLLIKNGYTPLLRSEKWQLEANKKYFITYADSCIVAFRLPAKPKTAGLAIVGAHTDSPNLRLKMDAETNKDNYLQVGVEVYGGVLINSWIDRDLSLAGRALVKVKNQLKPYLYHIKKPIARVSQTAIHLSRSVNDEGLKINPETQLSPTYGLSEATDNNHLLEYIAKELKVKSDQIVSYEGHFCLSQDACYGGLKDDFIYAPRLDNLAMCHASAHALANAKPSENIQMITLFDHEEVGSRSIAGADSGILKELIDRIYFQFDANHEQIQQNLARSFQISADMAHAIHPNFNEKHGSHRPKMNHGPVIKINQNQRYSTSSDSFAKLKQMFEKSKIPFQTYYHRNDIPCGSTIGPFVSSLLNIETIDMGNPMLSMHSSREVAGSEDHPLVIQLFKYFFENY